MPHQFINKVLGERWKEASAVPRDENPATDRCATVSNWHSFHTVARNTDVRRHIWLRERTTSSPAHGRQFIEDICEVVRRAVSDPPRLLKVLGEPKQAGIGELYRTDELSILNVAWSPHMMIMPHNHRMWAVIGVYGGRKDNIFWRRIASADGAQIEASGARSLCAKEAQPLGHDIIPVAIHFYGGDFFAVYRSEWDPETLREQPSDGERAPDIRGSQPTLCRRLKLRREPA
jgi:predicted metal-dependent enzyme (double-stranded beta helix superfamily)